MTRADFLRVLDVFFDLPTGTLNGTEVLKDLPGWDSLKLVELIALVDDQFGISVPVDQLAKTSRIEDLIASLGERLES